MDRISNISLSEIMTKDPVTVEENAPFSRVERLFSDNGIRHLPVVNEDTQLMGLITQRDLYRTVSPMRSLEGDFFYTKDKLDRYILKHVMTKDVVTLNPKDSLASAIEIMARRRFGCIPVVEDNNILSGIVTQIDILQAISTHPGWII